MGTGYFTELNDSINKTYELLLGSTDLVKLLYYNDSDPLKNTAVSDPTVLIENNLFPYQYVPEAQEDVKSLVCAYFFDISPYKGNRGAAREELLCFDIIVHSSIWRINSALRPYSIMSQIDLLFNNKQYSELSMKNIYFENAIPMKWSNYFHGHRMLYQLGNDSNMRNRSL